jgi:hypothetical protein
MSGGGGGGNLLNMGLMIAAGIAAPELAPELLDAEGGFAGLTGASALTGATAATGAGLSGLAAAATGQNVLRSALMGGVGGALSGYMAPAEGVAGGGAGGAMDTAGQAAGTANLQSPVLGNITPEQVAQNVASGNMSMDTANLYGQGYSSAFANPSYIPPAVGSATTGQMIAGAGTGLMGYQSKRPGAYTPPNAIDTGGSLSKFKYDPNNYTPDTVVPPRPPYQANYSGMAGAAEGGIMSLASGGYAHGGKTYNLGDYSDGGRLLKGPGDGMSDDIPATIGHKQEARLADGEFVVPADVVSGLGNGSTDAGAKHLYKMMDKVRHARTGRKTQGKQIEAEKYVPA